jgi:hypothetical protein
MGSAGRRFVDSTMQAQVLTERRPIVGNHLS